MSSIMLWTVFVYIHDSFTSSHKALKRDEFSGSIRIQKESVAFTVLFSQQIIYNITCLLQIWLRSYTKGHIIKQNISECWYFPKCYKLHEKYKSFVMVQFIFKILYKFNINILTFH